MLSDFHPFRRKGTLKIQLCPHFTMPWKIQENSQTIPKTLPIKVWFIQLISVFFWIKLNSPEDPSISSFTFVIKYTSLKNHLLRAQGDSLPYWLQGNFCSFVCPLSAIAKCFEFWFQSKTIDAIVLRNLFAAYKAFFDVMQSKPKRRILKTNLHIYYCLVFPTIDQVYHCNQEICKIQKLE